LWREENRRRRRKTLRAGTRTNNKLNPHMAPGQNRTCATLVGGEHSHHCPAPPKNMVDDGSEGIITAVFYIAGN